MEKGNVQSKKNSSILNHYSSGNLVNLTHQEKIITVYQSGKYGKNGI